MLAVEALVMEIGRGARAERVLRGVSLTLEPGEVVGLVGESGAGKSMIGRVVLGVAPPAARVVSGSVRFFGEDLLAISERRRRALLGAEIALIPQDPMSALNPVLRIERQITDVMRLHLGLGRRAGRARALELLEAVRVANPARVLRQYPHELSGGMRQRVLIAIAFACRPKLIIADEPTTALDVTVQRQVLRLMRDMQRSAGSGVLFISHDLGVVAKLCNRVSVMHAGRVVESGPVADVVERPQHPYTRALLAATPRYDRPAEALVPVPAELSRRLWDEARALDGR
jgi:peptide/nickel transport system ATP-binding protein